jgi:hypothetical protein
VGLPEVDELNSELIGAALDGGGLAAGDESRLDAHGVGEAQALSVMGVEDLHLGDFCAGQRYETDAAIGEGAVDIHEKEADLAGAVRNGKRCVLLHNRDFIVGGRGVRRWPGSRWRPGPGWL